MNRKQLKALAQERIAASRYSARKLAFLFTGGSLALSLVITLVNFLLNKQIEGTGGLGGIGLRTILSFVQTLVMLAGTVALPFWNLGYTRAALDTARDGSAQPQTLLSGFRLFFPALRLYFLQTVFYTIVITVVAQAGSTLYMFTPFANNGMEVMEKILAGGETLFTDPAVMQQLLQTFWPMYLLVGVLVIVALTFVSYRLRLVEFALVDGRERALQNMLESNRNMRGKCGFLFRLDLSFWWYFLLQVLASVLAYGDLLIGGDVAYWVFCLLSAGVQLLLGWAFLPRVQTTYALVYDMLANKEGQVN